jgi:hypothetical protein
MMMTSLTPPLALFAAFTLVSSSSFAQERGQGRHGRRDRSGQESSGHGVERARPRGEVQPRQEATAPRPEGQRDAVSPRTHGGPESARAPLENRRETARQRAVPRRDPVAPRNRSSRDSYSSRDGYSSRGYSSRGYSSGGYSSRGYSSRGRDGRYDRDSRRYRYSPRYGYSPRYYQRPYVFRPRFSIGFGIFAGYPVPYTYRHPYPIAVYGYRAPPAPVIVGPGSPLYGAVALEINPADAEVYVDGSYAGYAGDFDGTQQPLTLTAGTHRIEVQAPGYAPLVIDVIVQPGQVVPYRGDMRPY